MIEPAGKILLPLAVVALIAVLCCEHKKVAGVTNVDCGETPAEDEIVGLSNAPVQRPGPAYLQFNQPWLRWRTVSPLPSVTVEPLTG